MPTEQIDPKPLDVASASDDVTPPPSEAPTAPATTARPAYRKPSITRHGNLRMMTQLE